MPYCQWHRRRPSGVGLNCHHHSRHPICARSVLVRIGSLPCFHFSFPHHMGSQSGLLAPARGLHYLSDMPLICLNSDAVTIPFNDAVEYSPALLEVWVSPEYLFPDLILLDIILMWYSTADRCPPIVMSSPCTVATTSSPLMCPRHTHGRATPRVSLRSLNVDASSSSQNCAASRVPYRLYRSSPHMCSSPGW